MASSGGWGLMEGQKKMDPGKHPVSAVKLDVCTCTVSEVSDVQ